MKRMKDKRERERVKIIGFWFGFDLKKGRLEFVQ